MPVKKIVDLANEKKIPVLVDGCQGAPHLKIDMQELTEPELDSNKAESISGTVNLCSCTWKIRSLVPDVE